MDYINAFWIGGVICALVQILLDRTKLMPGRVMVLLVCSGAVLGALHIYQPFQDFAGAGASVPLTGFGNLLWKGVKEAVDKEEEAAEKVIIKDESLPQLRESADALADSVKAQVSDYLVRERDPGYGLEFFGYDQKGKAVTKK